MTAKRWWVDDPEFSKLLISDDGVHMRSFVLASDYDSLAEELAKEKEHYAALSRSMDNNSELLGETYTQRDKLLAELSAARAHLDEAYATIRAIQGSQAETKGEPGG